MLGRLRATQSAHAARRGVRAADAQCTGLGSDGAQKKRRTHVKDEQLPHQSKAHNPKSFVLRRGRLANLVGDLEADIRHVMEPNTATSLKESKKNSLKDFVHVAGPLGVSHFLILSATEKASYLRIATVPRGPTLTLAIHEYTLAADIAAASSNYSAPPGIFKTAPLVVLNNFVGEKHLRLAAVVCQNMFPAINVKAVKLAACKRVVLLDYDADSQLIMFRHYHITAQPAGVSKRVRRLVMTNKEAPNLKGMSDISDYLGGGQSDSEGEDAGARVTLAQDVGRANSARTQSSLKLHELGPRMALELVKLEEGVCTGQVLYHKYVEKTPEEVAALVQSKESAAELKAKRKAEQAANVERKAAEKEAARQAERARQGMKPKGAVTDSDEDEDEDSGADGEGGVGTAAAAAGEESDDSDTEWYRREVGEEPDENFKRNVKARKVQLAESAKRSEERRKEREQAKKESKRLEKRAGSAALEKTGGRPAGKRPGQQHREKKEPAKDRDKEGDKGKGDSRKRKSDAQGGGGVKKAPKGKRGTGFK